MDGFDQDGFNKNGFDNQGFDRNGFSIYDFKRNKESIDKEEKVKQAIREIPRYLYYAIYTYKNSVEIMIEGTELETNTHRYASILLKIKIELPLFFQNKEVDLF